MRSIAVSISWALLTAALLICAQDPKLSAAKLIIQPPSSIQEPTWQPRLYPSSSPQADSVRSTLFSFYNGELYRILVSYDRRKTEGLTTKDMVEAISARYGTATKPTTEVAFSSSQVYNDSEVVLARWESSQYWFSLFPSSHQPTFGVVGYSKRLDTLAQTAIAEAIRLDEQEAPQREIERQNEQDAKDRAGQEKARLVNKPTFRP